MGILLFLAMPLLTLCVTLALARVFYMRRMVWPGGTLLFHRPLHHTWIASWMWTGIFLFFLLMRFAIGMDLS